MSGARRKRRTSALDAPAGVRADTPARLRSFLDQRRPAGRLPGEPEAFIAELVAEHHVAEADLESGHIRRDGQVYRYSEIAERTFGPDSPPDSLWEYVAAEHGFAPAGPSDPLVDGQEASRAVAALRAAGLSYREIARRAGVAFDSVQRAASGGARVRYSTERALTGLARELGS